MNQKIEIKQIQKITLIGVLVNILLSIIKVIFGIKSHSQALLADGVHSISDLTTDAAIIIGSKFWTSPPDKNHPYGHGRIETIVNIFIGFTLCSVGIGIGWHSLITIGTSHHSLPGWNPFIVAVISICFKEILFRRTVDLGKKLNSKAVIANAWHHRSDALSSLPVAAAVIGNKIFPNLQYLDHIAALLVTTMILKASYTIIWPSIKEITESRADVEIEKRILQLSRAYKEIREIHALRSRRIGGSILVDLHMLFDPNATVYDAHKIAETFKKDVLLKEKDLAEIIIHIEPYINGEKRMPLKEFFGGEN